MSQIHPPPTTTNIYSHRPAIDQLLVGGSREPQESADDVCCVDLEVPLEDVQNP